MKRQIEVGLFLTGLLVAASGFARPPQTASNQNPDSAKSLVNLLERQYRNARTLRAVFLERYSEGPRDARVESGTVFFKRPGQMRWEYDSPEQKLFLVDGKTVWFYVPYDHTVTKTPVKESEDWRTPISLLTGKANLGRLCSRVDLIEQKGVPPGHAVLRCLPKGEKTPSGQLDVDSGMMGDVNFTDVLLEIDKSTGELARIEIRQPGNVELEYRFGDWRDDLPLDEAMFHFKVPPGVAIVDANPTAPGSP